MNLKEKYGEWGIILGATEGIGKAFCEKLAEGGMSVVMVGRREEKLQELGKELSEKYGVKHLVIRADFSEENCTDKIFEATRELDMGFMAYVACLHQFGKLQDTPWEDHQKMLNVNINTFLKCFYHYMGLFSKQDRGAVINVSSLTGVTSSPYNAQYGACKAYILKLTEAVAYEAAKTNVDVMAITLGATLTPSYLSNLPGGEFGEQARSQAMEPKDVVDEAFEQLGNIRSHICGEANRQAVENFHAKMTSDEAAAYMGSFYEQ